MKVIIFAPALHANKSLLWLRGPSVLSTQLFGQMEAVHRDAEIQETAEPLQPARHDLEVFKGNMYDLFFPMLEENSVCHFLYSSTVGPGRGF